VSVLSASGTRRAGRAVNWLRRAIRGSEAICHACLGTLRGGEELCSHCGALLRDPRVVRRGAPPGVTATWRATTAEHVREVGGWVHDAHFDWERITFDVTTGVVTVPFQQEPTTEEECGQAGQQLVARGRLGSWIFRVPFVECRLSIGMARACLIQDHEREDPGMLDHVDFDADRGAVRVATVVGPEITVPVDALDVEIVMTDKLAFFIRRVSAGGRAHADSRWPDARR
jgi:hypothetical protein